MALNLDCIILILLLINLSGSFQNHTHQNTPSQFPNHYFAPSGLFFLLPFDFIEDLQEDCWLPPLLLVLIALLLRFPLNVFGFFGLGVLSFGVLLGLPAGSLSLPSSTRLASTCF